MTKLVLNEIESLANTQSAKQALNENFDAILEAFENTLSRDGSTPNQMEADIDLNSNDLLNAGAIDAVSINAIDILRNGVPIEQEVAYANKQFQLFSGDDVKVDFVLLMDPGSLGNLEVTIDGVMQRPGLDFSYSGTTLSFSTAPSTGTDNILVRFDEALAVATIAPISGPFVTVKDLQFGAIGNGIALDRVACQLALDYVGALGGGTVYFPRGSYRVDSSLRIWSNTRVLGDGIGATFIIHPTSHAFRNKNYETGGDSNIEVNGFTFDAQSTFDGGCVMQGVDGLIIQNNHFSNVRVTGVTVGVGISGIAAFMSRDIDVSHNRFDVPDYGVVMDGSTGEIRNARVVANQFTINWGTAVSCAKLVKRVTIADNNIDLLGDMDDLLGDPGSGIGIKLWDGPSLGLGPEDITVSGNTIRGSALRQDGMQAISVANFANNITITDNTIRQTWFGLYYNFTGSGVSPTLKFADNTLTDVVIGCDGSSSSDIEPTITGNTFQTCTTGIHSTLRYAVVSHNKFSDISGKAIHALNPCFGASISVNQFHDIGEEVLFIASDTSNSANVSFVDNDCYDACTAADNTYSVLQLNTQAHKVHGNTMSNSSGSVKPTWFIAGAGDWRLINDNWMFGARSGYRQTAGANDSYSGNIERGGIG